MPGPNIRWFTTGLMSLGLLSGCSLSPSRPTTVSQASPAATPQIVYINPAPAPLPARATTGTAYTQVQPAVTQVAAVTNSATSAPAIITASYEVPAKSGPVLPLAPAAAPEPKFPRGGEVRAPARACVDITAATRFGHGSDYAWLSGEVEYSRLGNGWRLRYASVDETDQYGGSVTLTGDTKLSQLKDGERIRVTGHFSSRDDHSTAPAYHVDSFERVASN